MGLCLPCSRLYRLLLKRQGLSLAANRKAYACASSRSNMKLVSAAKLRPVDVALAKYVPSHVTDVFLDFDGTLTTSSARACEYLLPLLQMQRNTSVWDSSGKAASPTGAISWAQLDIAMSADVTRVAIDFSDTSVFGKKATRKSLQDALFALKACGIKVHLLTMGTPRTCRALLAAAGYDTSIFQEWFGPCDMARNQGVDHLFENDNQHGFEFTVEEDILALEIMRDQGTLPPLIRRILTMELRLSKAGLVSACAGRGGLLVDDNWSKNLFDAAQKDVMYIHVDPEGVETTREAMVLLAEQLCH